MVQIIEDLETRHVVLTMPKFEFESKLDLVDTLSTMGMPNAFDPLGADFSGMDGRSCAAGDVPCLVISDVIHRAFVAVDEEGTEAAAATAAIAILESGAPGPPVEVIEHRPCVGNRLSLSQSYSCPHGSSYRDLSEFSWLHLVQDGPDVFCPRDSADTSCSGRW